jgi:hypothetical protein
VALKGIAETNKSPRKSTRKGLVKIPFRFLTGASTPTALYAPGSSSTTGTTGTFLVARTSATVYTITLPGMRIAPSTVGTGSVLANLPWIYVETTAAQYVSTATFASVATNNTTTIALTMSAAIADGTQVRGHIYALANGMP